MPAFFCDFLPVQPVENKFPVVAAGCRPQVCSLSARLPQMMTSFPAFIYLSMDSRFRGNDNSDILSFFYEFLITYSKKTIYEIFLNFSDVSINIFRIFLNLPELKQVFLFDSIILNKNNQVEFK